MELPLEGGDTCLTTVKIRFESYGVRTVKKHPVSGEHRLMGAGHSIKISSAFLLVGCDQPGIQIEIAVGTVHGHCGLGQISPYVEVGEVSR